MYKIRIVSVGKTKERWLEEALQEYIKRLSPYTVIEFVWKKDNEQLEQFLEKETFHIICLDPFGKMFTSEEFSTYLFTNLKNQGSRLTFVIGGAEGLTEPVRQRYPLFSLSKMTFTHQCTRLILLEQIYRAFEIAKGTAYHK